MFSFVLGLRRPAAARQPAKNRWNRHGSGCGMRVLLRAAAGGREAGEAGSSLYAPRVHKDQREEERSTLGAQSDL